MQNCEDVNSVTAHPVRHQERGAWDHQFPRTLDPSRPAHVRMLLESLRRNQNPFNYSLRSREISLCQILERRSQAFDRQGRPFDLHRPRRQVAASFLTLP